MAKESGTHPDHQPGEHLAGLSDDQLLETYLFYLTVFRSYPDLCLIQQLKYIESAIKNRGLSLAS
ncbi:MAG: hypothetical protein GXY53_07805 [Desulfobulbus sp.]|nr:hypothetical protein [Desulfobulbus sp.]